MGSRLGQYRKVGLGVLCDFLALLSFNITNMMFFDYFHVLKRTLLGIDATSTISFKTWKRGRCLDTEI